MMSPSGPRPISFKVRHVTHIRMSDAGEHGTARINRGPVFAYKLRRPVDGALKQPDAIVCEHCGRRLPVTVLTPTGMRQMRRLYALILGIPVAAAVVFIALVYLFSLTPGASFTAGPDLLAIPAGVALLAVAALLLLPISEKGVDLEDDRPADLPTGNVELAPEQQFHCMA